MNKSRVKDTVSFICRAKEVHGDKYDYSETMYVKSLSKVKIICPKHGLFCMSPCNHLHNHGCKRCAGESIGRKTTVRQTGQRWSSERRQKHSQRFKQLGIGKWMLGKKLSETTREKLSVAHTGKHMSAETCKHISETKKGVRNGMYGKHHSDEIKKKISEAAKAMWRNPEIRQKCMSYPGRIRHCREAALIAQTSLRDKGFANTVPELEMKAILDKLGIKYVHGHSVWDIEHCYMADFFLPDSKTIVEVDGTYWHDYPKGRDIDHIRGRELKEAGYHLVRFWEGKFDKTAVELGLNSILPSENVS